MLMRVRVYALIFAAIVWGSPLGRAQDSASPIPSIAKTPSADLPPTTSTVMRTNSMEVLDDKKKLGSNDFVSFRVVEERDNAWPNLCLWLGEKPGAAGGPSG